MLSDHGQENCFHLLLLINVPVPVDSLRSIVSRVIKRLFYICELHVIFLPPTLAQVSFPIFGKNAGLCWNETDVLSVILISRTGRTRVGHE